MRRYTRHLASALLGRDHRRPRSRSTLPPSHISPILITWYRILTRRFRPRSLYGRERIQITSLFGYGPRMSMGFDKYVRQTRKRLYHPNRLLESHGSEPPADVFWPSRAEPGHLRARRLQGQALSGGIEQVTETERSDTEDGG